MPRRASSAGCRAAILTGRLGQHIDKVDQMNGKHTSVPIFAAAAMLALAACSGGGTDALPVSTPSASPTVEAAEPSETPTPEAEAERGTRDNPLAPGEARLIAEDSAFTISGGATDFDAWPEVQAENEYNAAPVEGRTFVMFPLSISTDWPTVQAQSEAAGSDISGGINPYWVLSTKFVGNDGTSYDTGEDDYCGVVPNDWMSLGAIFDTTTVTGNVCVSVPTAVIPGGTWAVSNSNNAAVFIAAQ
jgi:hypothetical protein